MKTFNSSSLCLLATVLLLARVGGCASTASGPRQEQPQTNKIQTANKLSPCDYNEKTDRVRDELECDRVVKELGDAAEIGNIEAMKTALKKGADVNAMRDSHEPTLFVAIRSGQAEAVKFLIEQGADVNNNIRENLTPLKVVPPGRSDITDILIAHGAKP